MKTHASSLRFSCIAACLLPPIPFLFSAPLAAQGVERYTLAGGDVAVYNLAGRLEIVPGTGSAVEVEATLAGADANELSLVQDEIDGREALRVVFPGDEIVYPALGRGARVRISVGDDGTFGDEEDGDWLRLLFGFDRVTIRGSGRGLEAHADLRIAVPAGQRIAVYLGAGEVTAMNVGGELRIKTAAGRIETRGTEGVLRLDAGSGNIDVADATGDLDADTGSGGITVDTVRAEHVSLDTGSGGIVAGGIEAADVSLDTGSGSVSVDGVRGQTLDVDTGSGNAAAIDALVDELIIETGSGSIDVDGTSAAAVDLETGSGRVAVTLMNDVQSLSVETGSGSVTIGVPAGLGAAIEIETGSGGMDLGVPVEAQEVGHSYLRGRIGDGDGRIKIETGSGRVRLEPR